MSTLELNLDLDQQLCGVSPLMFAVAKMRKEGNIRQEKFITKKKNVGKCVWQPPNHLDEVAKFRLNLVG